MGIHTPTPIQAQAIPLLLEEKQDLIGLAQTGTGKTAAFSLPLLERIDPNSSKVQAVILSPTRELGQQIAAQIASFSQHQRKVNTLAVYGGTSIVNQIRALKKPVQVVIATPGRLLDLIRRKAISLRNVEYLVLDEADEMLNMGFKEDIDEILKGVERENSVTWLFSATMPSGIRSIIKHYMSPTAKEVKVSTGNQVNKNIEHQYMVLRTEEKTSVLKLLMDSEDNMRGIVFCRTKLGCQKLSDSLSKEGYLADALHGDLSQNQRDAVMGKFKAHRLQVLCATDVAARGIDVNDLTHVIHYNLPDNDEYYTHRSGRTARAGKTGVSIALVSTRERTKLLGFARNIKIDVSRVNPPSGRVIVEKRVMNLAKRIENIDVPRALPDEIIETGITQLEHLSKTELITKMIAMEVNSMDLDTLLSNKPPRKTRERDDRPARDERKPRGDRKERPERKEREYKKKDDYRSDSFDSPKESKARKASKETAGYVRFFINLGKVDQVKKDDLVEFLHEQGGVEQSNLGNITVNDQHSFFEVDEKSSKKIAQRFKGLLVNGRPLRVNRDDPGASFPTKKKGKGKPSSKQRKRS
jgi:ATP-dependent RNA helicase DeaD